MTRAVFQASGSCPEVYDCWKMWCIMGDISFAVSFSTFAGISSGPEALLGQGIGSMVMVLWLG